MISVPCQCGRRLTTHPGNAGRQVACPHCGRLVRFDPGSDRAPDVVQNGQVWMLPEVPANSPDSACPNCGSTSLVEGRLSSLDGHRFGEPLRFAPPNSGLLSRVFGREPGVPVTSPVRACLACGHLGATLSAEALRDYVDRHGDEEGRRALRPFVGKREPELA